MDDQEVAERVGRVEVLLEAADAGAVELAGALLDLYGEALARVMAAAGDGPDGAGVAERIASDGLVSHLLLVHGLHPVEARARIERVLAAMGGRLGSAVVEVVAVEADVARLRLRRAAGGCGSSGAALGAALEEAVRDAAPEIERVEIESVDSAPPAVVIPVESLFQAPVRDAGAGVRRAR
ncbi:NifU family protein [Nonomuraea sp. LPB2021202275-12-8]|uniref:NifU family protein n=1 Tax=Nonomuraea sp. LPB2021202275-12-8 TaxID=3120159 RepID=UPI00300D97F9